MKHLEPDPGHTQQRLGFMTGQHHRIRYFVVKEMLTAMKPIEPATISERLQIPLDQVSTILDELERKLFFLVRDDRGAVTWAYPITVEPTPHLLKFSSGEQVYAA